MKTEGKVFVVSGGGNGIGRELVLTLIQNGAKVAAVDLNEKALKETLLLVPDVHKDNLMIHVLNITDKPAVDALPQQVISRFGAVDGLINNAGIIQPFVPVKDLDFAAIDRVINVNLYGMLYMTKAFLPELLKRPQAHLVNVSSMGGFFPFPGQSIYGAAKAGVKLLTEGLQSELADTNLIVSVVFPGAIGTNIMANSGLDAPKLSDADAKNAAMKMLTPQQAAQIIVKGIEKNKTRMYVGKDSRMLDIMYRINPKWASGFIAKKMKGQNH